MSELTAIAVIGAGSWGTALAMQMARCGSEVRIWGRDKNQLEAMQRDKVNARYLPDSPFPAGLTATADLAAALKNCRDVMISTPSHAYAETLHLIKPLLAPNARVFWATKGLYQGQLLSDVTQNILGHHVPVGLVSGPTFAKEVAKGLPSALTAAASDTEFANDLMARFHGSNFRVYINDDLAGVQIGGAVKNVLAVAAGISDGLGFGANSRAALITRGLAELMRLGEQLGGERETLMGLSGLGDLILTCTDNQSRNRRFGIKLAEGKDIETACQEVQQVVEGIHTADEVWKLAQKHGVEMPISEQIYGVIHGNTKPAEVLGALISRKPRKEGE